MDNQFIKEILNETIPLPRKDWREGMKNNSRQRELRILNRDRENAYKNKYHKKYPWKRVLRGIKLRCNVTSSSSYERYGGKGIKNFITSEEIKYLWIRDNASNMTRPSIDRINPKDNYTVQNCRFIELYMNNSLSHRKLDESKVLKIRRIYENDCANYEKIGRMYGVTGGTISAIIKGDTWRHV